MNKGRKSPKKSSFRHLTPVKRHFWHLKNIAIEQALRIERMTICKFEDGTSFALVSTPVTARPRKLRVRWTVELDQELMTFFGP